MTCYHPVIVYTLPDGSEPVEWEGTGYDTLTQGYLAMWSRESDLIEQGFKIEKITVILRDHILVENFLEYSK